LSANQSTLNGHSKSQPPAESCRPAGRGVKSARSGLLRPGGRLRCLALLLAGLALPLAAAALAADAPPAATAAAPEARAAAPDAPATAPAGAGGATEPAACRNVRFSDVGWTDVTATTALTAQLLRTIGYTPSITVLSVPVTFASMQNKDVDVFLGDWMPAQEADRAPYLADGSVVVVGPNLEGAKYTLAVPAYTYAAGLRDFNDIKQFAPALNHEIYGIEAGNDGNRLVLKMLKQDSFGLGDFKLVESSEQGMLAQVERSIRNKQPIVFLAWEPHPMNMRFDLKYLAGGDSIFGPNYGGATIYTLTRKGFSTECPNVGRSPRPGSPASPPSTVIRPPQRSRAPRRRPAPAALNNGWSATRSLSATRWPR
jgi:glycine betaine/proline transport system substrate-binding protein